MSEASIVLSEIADLVAEDGEMAPVALLSLPGEPVSKARARFTKYGSKVHAYTPEKTRVGEDRIKGEYLRAVGSMERDTDATFRIEVDFYCGTRQRRDVDNMLKLVLDALNGIAYPDDVQVLEVSGRKHFTTKSEARTEIVIFKLTGGMSRPTQPCLRCGTPFLTYESWQSNPGGKKYCSPNCAYTHRLETRERSCGHCATTFYARKSDQRFCSRDCSNSHGKEEIACTICGTSFTQFKSWVAIGRACCSQDCYAEKARRGARERRTKSFPGLCLICGTGTTRKEYKRCNTCKLGGRKVPE